MTVVVYMIYIHVHVLVVVILRKVRQQTYMLIYVGYPLTSYYTLNHTGIILIPI